MNKTDAIRVIEERLACEERLGYNEPNTDFDRRRMESNEAFTMALEALNEPLLVFLREEVDYRLREFFEPKEELLKKAIGEWEYERERGAFVSV